jgi:hypothetical protein
VEVEAATLADCGGRPAGWVRGRPDEEESRRKGGTRFRLWLGTDDLAVGASSLQRRGRCTKGVMQTAGAAVKAARAG